MILLSFDIEEFDLPTEYGLAISWEEQLRVSREGSGHILDVLARHGVRATFFCTARFAEAAPDVLRAICDGGHEVASHGYAHSAFEEADLTRSREILPVVTTTSTSRAPGFAARASYSCPPPPRRACVSPSSGSLSTTCRPRSTVAWPASPCATTATYSSTSTHGSSCPCKAYRGCRDSSRVTVAPQPWSASIS